MRTHLWEGLLMNRVQLFGRISQKSELRQTKSGVNVINVNVATGYGDKVTFVPVTAWDTRADIINDYINKGDQVVIEGRITANKIIKDNVSFTEYKVTADLVHLVGSKKDKESKTPYDYEVKEPERPKQPQVNDSDLPF